MKGKAKAAEFIDEGYKIHVTGRDVLVTDAMKDYVIEKISKIERFSSRIIDVAVTMDITKLDHRVDIVLKVDHVTIKSHATTTDMYVSVDQAIDKIQRQLMRYKKKLQEHAAKPLNVVDLQVNVIKRPEELEIEEINQEIEEQNNKKILTSFVPHKVVCQETAFLKMLTLDEAVMKMELSGDAFLLYRSEEDQKLKIIFRRSDEDYGVISVES